MRPKTLRGGGASKPLIGSADAPETETFETNRPDQIQTVTFDFSNTPASSETPEPQNLSGGGGASKPSFRKRRVGFALAALAILALAGGAAFFLLGGESGDSWFDQSAKAGQYEGKSEEEIVAALNAQVEEGMMNISIASVVKFADGTAQGEARIENIQANHVDQKVSISLDETGESIYESGALAPGQYIQTIPLSKDLDPGTYEATATFTGYDRETHDKTGSAAAQITLIVEG